MPNPYTMDDKIKHPYMAQFTVGIEQELFKDTSVGVTYINRKWNNIIGRYDRAADDTVDYYSYALDETFPALRADVGDRWRRPISSSPTSGKDASLPWVLTDIYRKYEGLEILFNKRFSNRWRLLASYVYSKSTGTRDNSFGGDLGWGADPSDQQLHQRRRQPDQRLHPHAEDPGDVYPPLGHQPVGISDHHRRQRGRPRVRTSYFNQGRITLLRRPRGSNHYPMQTTLDLRLEKIFTLAGKYRLGVIFDVFNVFNDDTITSWGTRIGYDWFENDWPSLNGHQLYGIARPRQARLGLRLIF